MGYCGMITRIYKKVSIPINGATDSLDMTKDFSKCEIYIIHNIYANNFII